MLEYTHNWALVASSLAIAFMAGFTGLSLLRGASNLPITRRKINVSMAALVLGGGIWSMHFVAMLGVRLPIDFHYDPLTTLMSALVAVLVVGIALLILHFWKRTAASITFAGAIVGIGVLAMHFGGMSGVQRCLPVYSSVGLFITVVTSIFLNICVFWVAYGSRTRKNIVFGTIFFGLAVFTVHYVAMAGTQFKVIEGLEENLSIFGNERLAFIVTFMAFLFCSASLLSGITFLPSTAIPSAATPSADTPSAAAETQQTQEPEESPNPIGVLVNQPTAEIREQENPNLKIPYERDGRTLFLSVSEIAAARAEGHYTVLYSRSGKHFCHLSISEITRRLAGTQFIKPHRSYMVNPDFINGFERKKDNGICYLDDVASLEKVPVSRSHISMVRETLGLD